MSSDNSKADANGNGAVITNTASRTKRPRFDPVSLGLPEDFAMTDYTRLKGCSCKLPQPKLLALLRAVSTTPGQADVGMDCSIVPLRHLNSGEGAKNDPSELLHLVSTTDYFFPSVDDPYLQGQIGCANVLSDLYSMGIDECDTMLMLLAASTDMDENERDVSTREMMKGFAERAKLGNTSVTGGQTVMNPWPLIGGIAMRVVKEKDMVRPTGLKAGDVLVLTKPLGVQVAVNLKQWLHRPSPAYTDAIEGKMTEEEIETTYAAATDCMKRLNKNGATMMRKHGSHGATDVTGFGILGHSRNLAAAQDAEVKIMLHSLPMLAGSVKASKLINDKYKLFQGLSAETSGGLLVALPNAEVADEFIADLRLMDGQNAWVVGNVYALEEGETRTAELREGYTIIEV